MLGLRLVGGRTYIAEPRRGHQDWARQRAERSAVYANRSEWKVLAAEL